MKKSNIFMIAYVVFLFVVAGMKIFSGIQMFDKILLATTISSFFFSLGDFFDYMNDCYEKIYKFEIEIISTHKRRNKDCENNLPTEIRKLENNIIKDQKGQKLYSRLCNLCFGIGFFCFLFIICFYESGYSFIQKFIEVQDVVTLAAFAFSSLMYLIKEFFDNRFDNFRKSLDLINTIDKNENGDDSNGQA